MESRFLEPSVSQTFWYLEPNLVSLEFTSLKLYDFTPKTPDNLNQFWLLWDKLTLDNLNLWKVRNRLVGTSITFTSFPNWHCRISFFLAFYSHNKPQIHPSSVWKVQWLLQITEQKFPYLIVFLKWLSQYINKFCCPLEMKSAWNLHAFAICKVNSVAFHYSSTWTFLFGPQKVKDCLCKASSSTFLQTSNNFITKHYANCIFFPPHFLVPEQLWVLVPL